MQLKPMPRCDESDVRRIEVKQDVLNTCRSIDTCRSINLTANQLIIDYISGYFKDFEHGGCEPTLGVPSLFLPPSHLSLPFLPFSSPSSSFPSPHLSPSPPLEVGIL